MNYRELKHLNQSRLKKILENPRDYLEYGQDSEYIPKPHFAKGSVVDLALLEGKEEVDRKFITAEFLKPVSNGKIIELIYSISDETLEIVSKYDDYDLTNFYLISEDIFDGRVVAYAKKIEHLEKYKLVDFCRKVIQARISRKKIIDLKDYEKCMELVDIMLEHPYSREYFNPEYFNPEYERLTHVPVTFEMFGRQCKAELDLILFNDKEIRPFDLKTSEKEVKFFMSEFYEYRYDFQGAFYVEGLKRAGYVEDREIKDYRIILASFAEKLPFLFNISERILVEAFNGNNPRRLSIVEAFKRLNYHEEHGNWDYPKDFVNGIKDII